MRETLHKFLNRYPGEVYLLHADMWKWTDSNYKQINCGVQEPNMINIAAGLASQGKKVVVYGVAGFVIYKAYEQLKLNVKGWAEYHGSILLVNAGANGAYKECGRGHLLDDDSNLMEALNIKLYDPQDRSTFVKHVAEGLRYNGVRYIRLGWDNSPWRL